MNRSHVIRLNATPEQEVNFRKEALRLITDVSVVASSERKIACGAERSGSDDE
jgi:hypothetical protein